LSVTIDVILASWPILAGMIALLFGSAFFSSAETAVFSLTLRDLRTGSPTTVRALQTLLADRKRLLVTILLGNLVVNVLYFNLGVLISTRFHLAGATVASVATPLIVLALIILVGEIAPKSLAVAWPGHVARLAARPLLWCQRGLRPLALTLGVIADGIGRVLMGHREEEGDVDPEELGALLGLAAEEGHLRGDEHDALQAVLALSEMEVRELMVPRVDIVAFEWNDDLGESDRRARFIELVASCRLNKIPVHGGEADEIFGFLDVKEVLSRPDSGLKELVRPVAFVPESARVTSLLERFHVTAAEDRDRVRMLIVVDEYGGTEGLLTHEDLVEAVVGDFADETDADGEDRLTEERPGVWLVNAGVGIRALARLVATDSSALRVRTIGGLVMSLLDRLPRPGDTVRAGRIVLEVVSVRKRRPERVRVRASRSVVVAQRTSL